MNIRVLSRCLFFYYFYAIHGNNKGYTLASYRCTKSGSLSADIIDQAPYKKMDHHVCITSGQYDHSETISNTNTQAHRNQTLNFVNQDFFSPFLHIGTGIALTIMSHLYNLTLSLNARNLMGP